MNRLWHLWCALSGADPGDSRQKIAFNTDRRIAALSSHHPELVDGFATHVWSGDPEVLLDDFLDQWLKAVSDDQLRRNEAHERDRRAKIAAESRQLEEASRRHEAEVEAQRRADEVAEERRRSEERVRQLAERETASAVRKQVGYLYNITAVENLASIASKGVLCHDLARDVRHVDLSNRGVQDLRDGRIVDGRPLHGFANLYFNPRNAMLAAVQLSEGPAVVLLEVSADVLDLPGAVVTDGNAANGSSRWWLASSGMAHIDLAAIRSFYRRTTDGDVDYELRRVTQAEALIPQRVPPRFIEGVVAPSQAALDLASRKVGHWPGRIERETFFAGWNN